MYRTLRWMRPLACGAVTLTAFQVIEQVDFNQIWFSFLLTLFNTLIALLVGGDPTTGGGGGNSLFGLLSA